jgi:hypothetical protein
METIHGLPAWRAAMEGFFAAFPDAAYHYSCTRRFCASYLLI